MARNEEKAQLMLNKWVTMKEQFTGGTVAERRPFHASEVDNLADAEKWRLQIIRETTRKVSEIQNAGLGEHKIRDVNDQINKLLREKGFWQKRIKELGGPDYNALEPKAVDAEGRVLPGGGGYRYFGAARDLPGVKELFQRPEPVKRKRTRGDMVKNVTPDYYGWRDDDDGRLAPAEAEADARHREEDIAVEQAASEDRRKKRRDLARQKGLDEDPEPDTSDDDPDGGETEFLAAVERAAADSLERFEFAKTARTIPTPKLAAPQDLESRKSALLELFVDGNFEQAEDDEE